MCSFFSGFISSVSSGGKAIAKVLVDRILLTLSTGTGKTSIACQVVCTWFHTKWNLLCDGSRSPRILFLADRNVLLASMVVLFMACNHSGKQVRTLESQNDHSNEVNKMDHPIDPIVEFKSLIEEGKFEDAISIISKYGVYYKDEYSRGFYTSAVGKSTAVIEYMLKNGYIMNPSERYLLFEMTKSDTTLFSSLYLKYVKDVPDISRAVLQSCDVKLLKYYLETEKPDIAKCSFHDLNMSDFNCLCLINHCEVNSIEIIDVLLRYNRNNFKLDNECLVENWIQDFPKLADSTLVEKLIKNELIPETENWTPLSTYCTWNENGIVEMLLKRGYSPNWNNSSNLLYYALTRAGDGLGEHLTKEIRNRTVEILLTYGASPELDISIDVDGNNTKMNFIDFAHNWKFEDNTELLKILDKYKR